MHLTVQQLSSALDGALTGPSLELAVRHLAACHECRDRQARLARQDDALRRLLAQSPAEPFLDDLTRRSEALVMAITRGLPAPVMVTSVPLLHEEDPYAPVEPPPPRPRPELGRSGEMALAAGFGRIGVKPSASTQAPQSDPEEAQRLLEALASGNTEDFTELAAQGVREHEPVDGPVFDVPDWIKDPSRRASITPGNAPDIPRLDVYFEKLGEQAAGMTRESVDEVFRRDDPISLPDFAVEPEARPEPQRLATAPGARGPALFETASLDPGAWTKPMTAPFDEVAHAGQRARRRKRSSRRADHSLVLALCSVGGLIAIVFALQLVPAPPRRTSSKGSMMFMGMRLPRVQFTRHELGAGEPVPRPSRVQTASTLPPLWQVIPPMITPDTAIVIEPAIADSAKSAPAVVPVPVPVPERAGTPPAALPKRESSPPAALPKRDPVTPAALSKREPATSSSAQVTPVPAPSGGTMVPRSNAATTQTPKRVPLTAASSAKSVDERKWPLICGQVEDSAGMPVPGARVSVTDLTFAIRTDARGRFCLSAPAGEHTLVIEILGHSAHREAATFANGSSDLRIRLRD